MSNLGSSDTPIEGKNFSLPTGAQIAEDNGDFVVKDSSGNVVFRRNESANEWQFERGDITGVSSLSTDEAVIDGNRVYIQSDAPSNPSDNDIWFDLP